MPVFSKSSREKLSTCHPDLILVAERAIEYFDFRVLEGFRGEADQNAAVARGVSKTPWPKSKHNKQPSLAFDAVPYPFDNAADWQNYDRFEAMAQVILNSARLLGIKLRWGGNWRDDYSWQVNTSGFIDMPHFEYHGRL